MELFQSVALKSRIVGFFPGLGSRSGYQNLPRFLLDCRISEVEKVYLDAANALGYTNDPEKLLMIPENLPVEHIERLGFIGAAFLVHNLALEAYLKAVASMNGINLNFMGYAGESFGMIASAVASGSISCSDGVKIAQVFTPLMMLAAEGRNIDASFTREIAAYLPDFINEKGLISEPFHVLALKGNNEDIRETLARLNQVYSNDDVEVHKFYSKKQVNIYVRSGIKFNFDLFMKNFSNVEILELKRPTTFLAHSHRMNSIKGSLEQYIKDNNIIFHDPHIPVISNHSAELLLTSRDVRAELLAITCETMLSQQVVEKLAEFKPDIILELGLGNKSVQLLADNNICVPVMAYTGDLRETEQFLRVVKLLNAVYYELEKLKNNDSHLTDYHYSLLRELFQLAEADSVCKKYLYNNLFNIIKDDVITSKNTFSPVYYEFIEIFQSTYNYLNYIDIGNGELVLKSRVKKKLGGSQKYLGKTYSELKIIVGVGNSVVRRTLNEAVYPETIVLHIGSMSGTNLEEIRCNIKLLINESEEIRELYAQISLSLELGDDFLDSHSKPFISVHEVATIQVIYQFLFFKTLILHHPGIFYLDNYYLEGGDIIGWLVSLLISGASSLSEIINLLRIYLMGSLNKNESQDLLAEFFELMQEPKIAILSNSGIPLQSKQSLIKVTKSLLLGESPVFQIHNYVYLNGNCQIISLGSNFLYSEYDISPYELSTLSIISPSEIYNLFADSKLEQFEYQYLATLTRANITVINYAKKRKLLPSTVYAYVNSGERLVSFGAGGSESMTMFVMKDQEPDKLIVRKVLSEALTTAKWDPNGKGEMLPPFAKAKKQAEFLQSLPEFVSKYFPKIYNIQEREIPIPLHQQRNGKIFYKELIYEMSYISGIEVSRFIEQYSPSPIIVAKLYSLIFDVLKDKIHTINRTQSPGNTLDISYFQKIEARLKLSRQTAPQTFNSNLLDSETIIINGVEYYNHACLLEKFRANSNFLQVLEPKFHSIVMGDTNTENIKFNDLDSLLAVQKLIDEGASESDIQSALDVITPESLGIMFLDPRSIGFQSDGSNTKDDAMYDNKPWHNSLGHYDEMHCDYFNLDIQIGENQAPQVNITFHRDNPFSLSYKVRDVEEKGGEINPTSRNCGMEDYFGPIMSSVYQDDPYWLIRFVFMMGTHFTAMPPFHFQAELDGSLVDTYEVQSRPVAIYCEGIKWLNWALELLEGTRTEFLGVKAPILPYQLQNNLLPYHYNIGSVVKGFDDLSNESRIITTPWSRLVRGIGLGQYPIGYDKKIAGYIRESFNSLLNKVLPESSYTYFSSLLANLILDVLDPDNNIEQFKIESATRKIISVIKTENNPYWRLNAGCILIDVFVKLKLDSVFLINEFYDFPNEVIAMLDDIKPNNILDENAGRHGDYEKLSAFTALFLSFGQLNIQDRLIAGERNYIIESLNLLDNIPSPFFRGRGGSMLLSSIVLIGFENLIFDGERDYMLEILSYLDRADEINNPPAFPQPMSEAFSKCYPLLTMLNAIAISGRNEYLVYKKDWIKEAKMLLEQITPVEKTHMGLYYIMALKNLGVLEEIHPDFDSFVEDIINQWKQIDPGENFFLHGISYSYIIETAMITGRLDLISKDMVERLVGAFIKLNKSNLDKVNRPYPFGYAVNALGEIGMHERIFMPNVDYEDKSPMTWVIDNISFGGREEGNRLYILDHSLINYALRLRKTNAELDLFTKFELD